ncbi:MAG: hypothetical protein V8S74_02710 [Lachnospirales bacterium]
MIGNCGYSQRNITIVALSLSTGIGFTQVKELFNVFPFFLQNVFAENCVAVVAIFLESCASKEYEKKTRKLRKR